MTDLPTGSPASLEDARAAANQATAELRRQELAARLCSLPGLRYASLGPGRMGPNLVTYDGHIVGQTHTATPGAFAGWYAQPANGNPESGPYVTARAAAAALIQEDA